MRKEKMDIQELDPVAEYGTLDTMLRAEPSLEPDVMPGTRNGAKSADALPSLTLMAARDHQEDPEALRKNDTDDTGYSVRDKENLFLSKVVSNMTDAVIAMDTHFRTTYINNSAAELFGYGFIELQGKTPPILNPDAVSGKQRDELFSSLQTGKEWFGELHSKHKNGSELICESKIMHLEHGGDEHAYVGILRDISNRKRAEQTLRESEKKWRNILVDTPQIGVAIDPRARIVFANRQLLDLTGWTEEEVIGKNWFEVFIPEDIRDEIHDVFVSVMTTRETGDLSSYENEIITKNGERRNVAWSNVVTKNAAGEILDVTCLGIDLTERIRAEAALRESEERYRSLAMQSSYNLLLHDLDGNIVDVNPRSCRTFGYGRDELLTMNIGNLDTGYDRRVADGSFYRDMKPGVPTVFETRQMNRAGEFFPAEIRLTRVVINGRTLIQALCRDITDEKRAEEERRDLENQLIQAQKMESIGRLAGGVAHDFNNMLGVILGHTETILEYECVAPSVREELEDIKNAAERSADLTRQLLAFARRQTAEPKILDLSSTVSSMLKMLRRLIGEHIELIWHPRSDECRINIDPTQLDQILANLAVNARDAITHSFGKISIEIEVSDIDELFCSSHPGMRQGKYCVLVFQDNGCGMDKATKARIFEPFFSTKNVSKGTGLGLSTVYGIVKQNRGYITVESARNQGTTFRVYFPCCTGKSWKVERAGIGSPDARTGNETILLVEDEIALLSLTKVILQRLGYQVLPAHSPKEAIRLAECHSGSIDLLLTDVVMPGMNGYTLADEILSIYPEIKMLFMSGYTADAVPLNSAFRNGNHLIHKPFRCDQLSQRVREILDS